MDDGLYGMEPSDLPTEDFGIHLGSFAGRGERGSLIMGLDVLVRMTANPFMPICWSGSARRSPPRAGHLRSD